MEETGPEPAIKISSYGLTDVGQQREHNEDSLLLLEEFGLFMVADGMGGHRAGDVASRMAVETMADFFHSTVNEDATWPYHFDTRLSEEENRLLTGIRVANRQVFEHSIRSREYQGMGTTVVTVLFVPGRRIACVAHVGDSRCYRIRDGELRLVTRDHSLVNDYLLAMPEMAEEQRSELPSNVITRALGMQDRVAVDLQKLDLAVGDVYLLCSDGLSGMMTDDEILDVCLGEDDLAVASENLIRKANENGGEDNVTAILIRVEQSGDPVQDDDDGYRAEMKTDVSDIIR